MAFHYDFAILGGDMRQIYLAGALESRGFRVITYGGVKEINEEKISFQEKQDKLVANNIISSHKIEDIKSKSRYRKSKSLWDAVNQAEIVIGPIPLTKDNIKINIEPGSEEIYLSDILSNLTKEQCFAAGCITDAFYGYGKANNIKMVDFMKDEGLALFNTIATAEGAIAEAILNSPSNLHKNKCLVVGYGRCGVTLAAKLSGIAAEVEICDKRLIRRSLAETAGYDSFQPAELINHIGSYSYIFNTVPELVFDESLLKLVRKEVLFIDIASAPGGIDYTKAKQMQIHCRLCLGLPGKYSPKDSAEALLPQILDLYNKKASG